MNFVKVFIQSLSNNDNVSDAATEKIISFFNSNPETYAAMQSALKVPQMQEYFKSFNPDLDRIIWVGDSWNFVVKHLNSKEIQADIAILEKLSK